MTKDIDFKKIFRKLLKYWWIVVALTAVCCLGAFLFTQFFIAPVYQTSSQYEATNFPLTSDGDIAGTTTTSYVQVKALLVEDYMKRVKSNDELMEMVLTEVNGYYDDETGTYPYAEVTASTVRNAVSTAHEGDSSMFTIKINSTDPKFAEVVIEAYNNNLIAFMEAREKRDNVIAINSRSVNAVKVSPNKISNSMLGALAGFGVAVVAIAMTVLFDNMIRTEEDLKQKYSLPILGTIPMWSKSGKDSE